MWDYRPGPRRGLAFAAMTPGQRALAWAVVDAAMSVRGAAEIRSIVALEPVLGDLERRGGRGGWERRDPERYWFAVFGDPAGDEPWSWRLGGHHVAVQATVIDGRLVASARRRSSAPIRRRSPTGRGPASGRSTARSGSPGRCSRR